MTRTLVPNNDGYYQEVTGTGPFWPRVNEDPADGVAYINLDPAALAFAKYSAKLTDYSPIYGNKRPNSVTVRSKCRQPTAAGYKVKAFLRINNFDFIHITQETPTGGFTDLSWTWDYNPATAEEWEDADLDSLEIGIEVENAASETGGVDVDNIVCDFEEENAGPGTWSTIEWSWNSQKTGNTLCYPIKPGTVTIYTDEVTSQVLTDEASKDGTLAGDGAGVIDYTTGRYSVEFTSTPPPGTKIFANYVCAEGKCDHCKTSAVRFKFTPGPSPWGVQAYPQVNQTEAFRKLVQKLDRIMPANIEWIPIEEEVEMNVHFGHRYDALPADQLFWRRLEPFGIGDNVEQDFTGETYFKEIFPGSLIITAVANDSSNMIVTDDGSGNLTGDVDGGGTNTVTYADGSIDVTFSLPVKSGEKVYLEYRYSPTDNGARVTIEVTVT
jgi:hypothetical protein